MTLYDQVFKGQYPEPYESFCDREHLPFEAKATWAHYCATERRDITEEARDALWGQYASRGFAVVNADGTQAPLAAADGDTRRRADFVFGVATRA